MIPSSAEERNSTLGNISFPTLLQQLGDEAGPARLVAGANAGAVVTMEILIERTRSFQCGSVWNFSVAAVNGPPAFWSAQE